MYVVINNMESLLIMIMRMIIIIILLFFITLFINILFGHQTFWRSSLSPSSSSTNILQSSILKKKISNSKLNINLFPLIDLNENLMREILLYLSPNDLLHMNIVNKNLREIIDNNYYLFDITAKKIFYQNPEYYYTTTITNNNNNTNNDNNDITAKTYFLQKVKNYEPYFIENNSNRLLIILYGKIFDLTDFALEHPGGDQILIHQNGKMDSTKEFENAFHSNFALQIAQNFIIYDRQDIFI